MCPSVTFLKLIYANIAYCPVLHVRTVFQMPFVLLPALTETFVGYAESAGMSVISMWRVSYYDFVWFFRARSIPKKCLVSQQDGQIDCWGAIWTTVWVSCIKWSWWFIIIRMPTFLIVFCNLSIFRGLYLSSSWALLGFFFIWPANLAFTSLLCNIRSTIIERFCILFGMCVQGGGGRCSCVCGSLEDNLNLFHAKKRNLMDATLWANLTSTWPPRCILCASVYDVCSCALYYLDILFGRVITSS